MKVYVLLTGGGSSIGIQAWTHKTRKGAIANLYFLLTGEETTTKDREEEIKAYYEDHEGEWSDIIETTLWR